MTIETFPNNEPVAYLNGEYVPLYQCQLPVFDTGIVLGAAVTDFLRTFNGRPRPAVLPLLQVRLDRAAGSLEKSIHISENLLVHNATLAPGRESDLVYYMTAGRTIPSAGDPGANGIAAILFGS